MTEAAPKTAPATVSVHGAPLDLTSPPADIAKKLRDSGLTCFDEPTKAGVVYKYWCTIPSADGEPGSDVTLDLMVEAGRVESLRIDSMSLSNFSSVFSEITHPLGKPTSIGPKDDGTATVYLIGSWKITIMTFPCDESCIAVVYPPTRP